MTVPVTLAVALGGALGSLLRYTTEIWMSHHLPGHFPWGTLTANLLGSLLIGWIAGFRLPAGHWLNDMARRQFMVTGFCGGFTTFSLFSLETLKLLEQARWSLAAANTATTLVLMMLAVAAGFALARKHSPLSTPTS